MWLTFKNLAETVALAWQGNLPQNKSHCNTRDLCGCLSLREAVTATELQDKSRDLCTSRAVWETADIFWGSANWKRFSLLKEVLKISVITYLAARHLQSSTLFWHMKLKHPKSYSSEQWLQLQTNVTIWYACKPTYSQEMKCKMIEARICEHSH